MKTKQTIVTKALGNIAKDVEEGKYSNPDGAVNTSVLMFVIGTVLAEITK